MKSLVLSVALHLIILCGAMIVLQKKPLSQLPVMLARVVAQDSVVAHPKTTVSKQGVHKVARLSNHPTLAAKTTDLAVMKANHDDALLALLHAAIASQQVYPASAIEARQSGKVTIRLLVYPDGHIENIALVHSSGIAEIDAAAMQAANAISPIAEVARYLKTPRYFSVDIVFEL